MEFFLFQEYGQDKDIFRLTKTGFITNRLQQRKNNGNLCCNDWWAKKLVICRYKHWLSESKTIIMLISNLLGLEKEICKLCKIYAKLVLHNMQLHNI